MKQVRPKKNLGQHFLTDLTIARRIADTVDEPYPELPVLEVGPGMGVMTQFLAEKPRQLKVVEIDRESVEYLEKRFPFFRGYEGSEVRGCEDSLSEKGNLVPPYPRTPETFSPDYLRRLPPHGPPHALRWWSVRAHGQLPL